MSFSIRCTSRFCTFPCCRCNTYGVAPFECRARGMVAYTWYHPATSAKIACAAHITLDIGRDHRQRGRFVKAKTVHRRYGRKRLAGHAHLPGLHYERAVGNSLKLVAGRRVLRLFTSLHSTPRAGRCGMFAVSVQWLIYWQSATAVLSDINNIIIINIFRSIYP